MWHDFGELIGEDMRMELREKLLAEARTLGKSVPAGVSLKELWRLVRGKLNP